MVRSRLAAVMRDNAIIYTTTRNQATQQQHIASGYHSTLVDFDADHPLEPWELLTQLDAIVITIPLPTRKDNSIRINNILSFIKGFKGQIICCSSTGIYPNEPKIYTESDIKPVNVATEAPFTRNLPQCNILRFGGLMGYDRYLSKYNITQSLDEPVNHIHADDAVHVIKHLITEEIHSAIINVVAPIHPTKSAVIVHQRGHEILEQTNAADNGKIISSYKLIKTLSYKFLYPNPLYFKTKKSK